MPKHTLNPSRAAEIADLANAVADYYFPNKWIDPEYVIHQSDITLSFNHYGDTFDGMLEWSGTGFHIYCNLARVENCTSTRARFTLGHELGHYFIDSHRNALQSGKVPAHPSFCSERYPELVVEQEAHHFSSNLLMPHERVMKVLDPEKSVVSVAKICSLQRIFDVSFQSAAIRAIESTNTPCAGVMWRTDGKVWYVVSGGFESLGYRKMKRDRQALCPDSATKHCFEKDESHTSKTADGLAKASAWFYGVNAGSAKDLVFAEEAVKLGKHGVFTIVQMMD
jgi:hypothetical protein